jgi:hypothetical protein
MDEFFTEVRNWRDLQPAIFLLFLRVAPAHACGCASGLAAAGEPCHIGEMATYRVVQLMQDGKSGWAVERSAPGEITDTGRFYSMRVEAQIEADRLTALEEKRGC